MPQKQAGSIKALQRTQRDQVATGAFASFRQMHRCAPDARQTPSQAGFANTVSSAERTRRTAEIGARLLNIGA